MVVTSSQRFSNLRRCPVCNGSPNDPRGKGCRCTGFTSDNERFAHCSREEYASELPVSRDGNTYRHLLDGRCPCGVNHSDAPRLEPTVQGERPAVVCETVYAIRNVDGALEAEHIRRDLSNGDKTFAWRRNGAYNLGDLRASALPFYGSQDITTFSPGSDVLVIEGEKAKDTATQNGFNALAIVTGANGTPGDDVLGTLTGFKPVLWSDNDEPGRQLMNRVARRLVALGIKPRVLNWQAPEPKDDAFDFFARGGTADELRGLLAAARPFTMLSPSKRSPKTFRPVVVGFDTLTPRRLKWLWPERIPIGKLTMDAGDPGLGKSTLTVDIAARVTRGFAWPDGQPGGEPAAVVLVSAEDDAEDTILPRFIAAGGDPKLASILTAVRPTTADGVDGPDCSLRLDDHLEAIEEAVVSRKAALLIIDPLTAFLGETDSFTDADVRSVLMPLSQLAERTRVSILVVMHLNKKATSPALYRPGGSIAFIAAARAAHGVAQDPRDLSGKLRLFFPLKQNLSQPASTLSFRVVPAIVTNNDGSPIPTSKIEWLGVVEAMSAEDILMPQARPDAEEAPALHEAEMFLKEMLEMKPETAKAVQTAAREAGIADKTLRRAKGSLGIKADKEGFGADSRWVWKLPPNIAPTMATKMATTPIVKSNGHLREPWPSLVTRSDANGHLDQATEHESGGAGAPKQAYTQPKMAIDTEDGQDFLPKGPWPSSADSSADDVEVFE